MNKINEIISWYSRFHENNILIKTESHEFEIEIDKKGIPHLLGLHYMGKPTLRGRELWRKATQLTDEEIYELINEYNPNKLDVVKERIENLPYFLKNIHSSRLFEQSNESSTIKSSHLLVKSETGFYLHLGIAQDKNYENYFETFLVDKDDSYFKSSTINERILSIEKWEQDTLVPFSFKTEVENINIIENNTVIEHNLANENKDFWRIEFNEVFENQKSYKNEIVTEELLSEIKQLDAKFYQDFLEGKDSGCSKFYFEHIVNDAVVDTLRVDVGSGISANKTYYDFIENSIKTNSIGKSNIKQSKLKSYEEEIFGEFLEYINDPNSVVWEKGFISIPPINFISESLYNGMNDLKLRMYLMKYGIDDPRFATFNQANEKNYRIKKGSKAIQIQYMIAYDKETNKPFDFKKLESLKDEEAKEYESRIEWRSKKHNLFNAKDIEGVEKYEIQNHNTTLENDIELQKELIRNCIKNMGLKFTEVVSTTSAGYDPKHDAIVMPKREQFKNDSNYFGTLLHEIAHASGSEKRLNRKLSTDKETIIYAKEELVAEFTSLFLLGEIGISHNEDRKKSYEYIKRWSMQLEENTFEIIDVMKLALKSKEYILEKGNFKELQQSTIKKTENTFLFARGFKDGGVKVLSATEENYEKLKKENKALDILIIDKNQKVISFTKFDKEELTFNEMIDSKKGTNINIHKALLLSWKNEIEKYFNVEIDIEKLENNETVKKENKEFTNKNSKYKKYDSTTLEEIKKISIVQYAIEELGLHPQKVGRQKISFKEHDSLIAYENNNTFMRFSTNKGGSIIDFVMEIENLSSIDAIKKLTSYYEKQSKNNSLKIVTLEETMDDIKLYIPEKNKTNKNVFDYLKSRGINKNVIESYVEQDLLYQDKKWNCCFVGKDSNGEIKEINQRGTIKDSTFKRKSAGSTQIGVLKKSESIETLFICEGVIDAMSYETLHPSTSSTYSFLSTNGVNGVDTILEKRKEEIEKFKKIILGFDNDDAGRKATEEIKKYFEEKSSDKVIEVVIPNAKDFNEDLKMIREKELEKDINLQRNKTSNVGYSQE